MRRPQLEINKLFSSQAKSFGSSQFNLAYATLHDRATVGGNSEIWGGFFDTAQITQLERLKVAGVQLVPLSFAETGSASTVRSLVQLQELNGKIFNASNHLKAGVEKYLHSIECEPGQVKLKCLSADAIEGTEVSVTGKVFVCTGVVQTIDLLRRSGLIQHGDELTLDEFDYELVIGAQPARMQDSDACVISYTPSRAAAHLLGLQRAHAFSSLKPFTIHQVFHARKQTLRIAVRDHNFLDMSSARGPEKFGSSIHYCNLKINGERLVDMAARLSPHLHFVSMASVSQIKPGPISSDIFSYLESIGNEL